MDDPICPECEKNMVRFYTGRILTTMPPQREYRWWCLCGKQMKGGSELMDVGERFWTLRHRWEEANRSSPPSNFSG